MALTIKRAKTETLSLRLDPKTKFVLDFVARVRGQSITTIVERAVLNAGDQATLEATELVHERSWRNFWDVNEGVRSIHLLLDPRYPSSFEEEELLDFLKLHWPFFFSSQNFTAINRDYVSLLWPKIDEYVAIWKDQKSTNFWAAGEAMGRDLATAKVKGPSWPATGSPASRSRESFSADLDDEIPF